MIRLGFGSAGRLGTVMESGFTMKPLEPTAPAAPTSSLSPFSTSKALLVGRVAPQTMTAEKLKLAVSAPPPEQREPLQLFDEEPAGMSTNTKIGLAVAGAAVVVGLIVWKRRR